VGPDGKVYVSDTMNCRVQVFDRELGWLRSFGSLGVTPGQFRRPKGIAVDRDNVVYVVDSDFNNFQMFDDKGRPLLAVGQYGPRPGQMILPAGIAVGREQRRVYVTEQVSRRVQVFERVGPGLAQP
jgi:DNA-binding beta-propeller fold protein YncE